MNTLDVYTIADILTLANWKPSTSSSFSWNFFMKIPLRPYILMTLNPVTFSVMVSVMTAVFSCISLLFSLMGAMNLIFRIATIILAPTEINPKRQSMTMIYGITRPNPATLHIICVIWLIAVLNDSVSLLTLDITLPL